MGRPNIRSDKSEDLLHALVEHSRGIESNNMRRIVFIVFFTLLCVVASAQSSATDSLYLDSIYRHLELDEYTITARVRLDWRNLHRNILC